jgi:hypothetical protein
MAAVPENRKRIKQNLGKSNNSVLLGAPLWLMLFAELSD